MGNNEFKFLGHPLHAKLAKSGDNQLSVSIHDPDTKKHWNDVFQYNSKTNALTENEKKLAALVYAYQAKNEKALNWLFFVSKIISGLYDFLELLVSILFDSLIGIVIVVILLALMAWLVAGYLVVICLLILTIFYYLFKSRGRPIESSEEIPQLREYVRELVVASMPQFNDASTTTPT